MFAYFSLMMLTAYAAAIRRGNVIRYFVFLIPTIYIAGFKYEVGFDWPVYSDQFETLSRIYPSMFLDQFWNLVVFYAQEPLFILTAYVASHVFGAYEMFGCAAYLLFVWSIFRVGRTLGDTNTIAAFVPIHLFLLFTLEFSTLRQMIALAIFNFGLALMLRGKARKSLVFMLAAPLFQASTIVFVLLAYWVKATARSTKLWLILGAIAVVGSSVIGSAKIMEVFGFFLPSFVAGKVEYYTSTREYGFSIYEQAFSFLFYIAVIYLCLKNRKSENEAVRFIATMTLYMSVFALISFAIPTMRNRMMYEITILASLLLFTSDVRFRTTVRLVIIPMGILFFMISLTQNSSFMFVPYQNYIWYQLTNQKSDGLDRQSRLQVLMRDP